MKKEILLLFLLLPLLSISQNKKKYLKANRYDLTSLDFNFPEKEFKVVGFGAYHGSAKTYDAELNLIKSLIKQNNFKYYIPETNYSQAYFFDLFLKNGDTNLLKELVYGFETIVMQEGTIETYKHWKKLKKINDNLPIRNKITVVGLDIIHEYKFPIMHLLKLVDRSKTNNWNHLDKLYNIISSDTSEYYSYKDNYCKKTMKSFIDDYKVNADKYTSCIMDTATFHYIIKNITYTFLKNPKREKIIFDNYQFLKDQYHFKSYPQFFKYGYFHILKSRETNYPSFFTRLIENKVFNKDDIITIMGYLTNSEVLWNKVYNEKDEYSSYIKETGLGIGDYWKEYFKGIRKLKKTKISDMTLFRLDGKNTPYSSSTDLIEVELFLKKSNGRDVKNKKTIDFFDYIVLISNSNAQTPIEELHKKQL